MRTAIFILLAYTAVQITVASSLTAALGIVVDIAFLIAALYSLSREAEQTAASMGAHSWFNVMVMSWIAATPQTVVGVYFATVGKYEAAYIDSMASTLVDAFLVTALVRLKFLDELKASWDLVALWVVATLAYGATIYYAFKPLEIAWFVIGAAALPALFVVTMPKTPVKITLEGIINLAVNTVATIWISWNLGSNLVQLHLSEEALGALAAIIATFPDFMAALIIRFILGRIVGEVSHRDALMTMLAAAVHDQISVPALITLMAPAAVAHFPWWINIIVSVMKLTLLDKRVFLLLGLPGALILLAYLLI